MTYSIDDVYGNQLTTGLSGFDLAYAAAQRLANTRGQSVWLYANSASDAIEVEPSDD